MSIWFTADLHLDHSNIIQYQKRPFQDVNEMNEYMIARWNDVVSKGDDVYILGDVGYNWDKFLPRLNGILHLIIGNHDRKPLNQGGAKYFSSVRHYLELNIQSRYWILCHYPIYEWNAIFRGAFHLHGHTHQSVTDIPGKIMDVGVDGQNDYTPWHYEQINKIMEKKEIRIPPRKKK